MLAHGRGGVRERVVQAEGTAWAKVRVPGDPR